MAATTELPVGWRHQNVLRKFDMILHYPDGGDYDENGCSGCWACLPCCKKPVFQAGQTVTGYLLLRPSRKGTIKGVSVKLRGTYGTSWKENKINWATFGTFFNEEVVIVENRLIHLEYKWYRFDFEYKLPATLPTSFEETDGKVQYYAYGLVTRPDGPQIETLSSHFEVQGQVDIDFLPVALHEPIERRKVKVFATDRSQTSSVAEAEALQRQEDHVYAVCALNKQAFVTGQSLIADVTVENHAQGWIQCMVKFEQVLSFLATLGCEERTSVLETPRYRNERRTRTTVKDLVPAWVVKVPPGGRETFSRMFDIPQLALPSTCYSGTWIPLFSWNHLLNRVVDIKYFIKVALNSLWSNEEACLPIEIVIGTKDSGFRQPLQVPQWDTPPSNGGPPTYEEYLLEEQV